MFEKKKNTHCMKDERRTHAPASPPVASRKHGAAGHLHGLLVAASFSEHAGTLAQSGRV